MNFFWISQGKVATSDTWPGQIFMTLCQIFSGFNLPKIIKIEWFLTEINKIKGGRFFWGAGARCRFVPTVADSIHTARCDETRQFCRIGVGRGRCELGTVTDSTTQRTHRSVNFRQSAPALCRTICVRIETQWRQSSIVCGLPYKTRLADFWVCT